jgi:hypothetical protein
MSVPKVAMTILSVATSAVSIVWVNTTLAGVTPVAYVAGIIEVAVTFVEFDESRFVEFVVEFDGFECAKNSSGGALKIPISTRVITTPCSNRNMTKNTLADTIFDFSVNKIRRECKISRLNIADTINEESIALSTTIDATSMNSLYQLFTYVEFVRLTS